MKNKASVFLKQIMSLLSSIAKAKTMAIKSKTNAAKARLIMFSLMRSKKVLLGSISNKIHNLLGHKENEEEEEEDNFGDQSKAIALYNAMTNEYSQSTSTCIQNYDDDDDDDDKYPDLTHSLFDEEELGDFDDQGGSVIDMVKNSKEDGENFSLEDEIDHVADLFIKKFHKQMRMQKLLSFKRYQELLDRSV